MNNFHENRQNKGSSTQRITCLEKQNEQLAKTLQKLLKEGIKEKEKPLNKKKLIGCLERKFWELRSLQFCKTVETDKLYDAVKPYFPQLTIEQYKEIMANLFTRNTIILEHAKDRMEIDARYLIRNRYLVQWRKNGM